MFAFTRIRVSAQELFAQFSLALFLAAFSALLCMTPLSAQNPATTVSVDASKNQHPINPNIYGFGMFMDSNDVVQTSQLASMNAPVHRFGGDLNSTYNWQQDAWNLSADWYWESYVLSSPFAEGGFADAFISATEAANSEPAITVPMLPYIAKVGSGAEAGTASLWSFSVKKYGAQVTGCNNLGYSSDPYLADAGSGCKTSGTFVKNDPSDAYTTNSVATQKAWLNHLINKWGDSTTATGVKYYILDNEPSDWAGTHADVHPNLETYDELWADIQSYAGAIKAADPNAKVIGPEEWSWWAIWEDSKDQGGGIGAGSDYATHGNMYYYPWLLSQLAAYKQKNGVSLIDILSVHCYDDGGTAPNVETRMLWDPTYQDPGWFESGGLNGGVVDYIPTMQAWVKAAFPNGDGPQIGCTEYGNWGEDDTSLAGATVHADVLGIFGYYGFDMGAYYGIPPNPAILAYKMYRNYDGKLSTFGDTSVQTTVANPDNLSSFAAVRTSDGAMTVIVINKQTGSTPVTINLANFSNGGTAKAYQISSASQTSINSLGSVTVANNAIKATVPAQSVTLYVIPAVTVAPAAPTGLTAAGGNKLVTLNWTASTGATSYNVYRGTTAGGESATPIATDVTAVTYVDTTVTNGTEYYYEVRAVNSIGTSGPSNEASATPSSSDPLFTATATASPNPVTQGNSTTLTVKVTCTENTMTNGSVSIVVLDPSGTVVQTTPESAQSFTNGQTLTYTPAVALSASAAVGTYTVEVNVSGSSNQLFTSIPSAGTFTVNAAPPPAAPAFTITGSVTDPSVSAGGSTPITATFTDTGGALTNGNIEVVVYDGSGTAVGSSADCTAASTTNSNVNIAAGGNQVISCTWTATGLTSGTYNVTGLAFSSGWSTEYKQTIIGTVTVQPPATTAPNAPTGLKATAGNATVGLSWTASSGATSYSVYRGTTSNGESTTPIASGLTSPAYTDNSAANGTKYYYYVTAVNSVGPSGPSNEVSATPSSSLPVTPISPTNLKAQAANDSVALTWTASSNATSYNVYRALATGTEGTTPYATNITGTNYTDSSAANGTTYYYEVAAVNGTNVSGMSNEVSATPSSSPQFTLTATATPNTVVALQEPSITATVSCTANCSSTKLANDTVKVTVWIGNVTEIPYVYTAQDFNTNPTLTYSNMDAGYDGDLGEYYIEVDVLDASGNVLATNPQAGSFFVTSNLSFLSPATATPPTITADGSSTVNFSITDVGTADLENVDVEIQMVDFNGNVVSYQIYPGQNFQPNATAQTYTYNWTPSALSPPVSALGVYTAVITINDPQAPWYTNYYTSLPATDATVTIVAGKSTGAAFTSTTTANPNPVVIGNTTDITSTFTNVGQAALSNATVKMYVIPPGGTLASPVQTFNCTGLTFTVSTGATPSQSCVLDWSVGAAATPGVYTVEIGVYDSTGVNNNYWNPSALLITVSAPPATPTGLTATGGNASVTLNWTASSGATSYNVYRGTTSGGENATPIITGITATTFTDTTVTNNTTYYYEVAAVNSTGISNKSNEASATPSAPPAAPANLTATAGNASVTLNWSVVSGATGYNVYRGSTPNGESATPITTVVTNSFNDSGLTNGKTYYYKVAAVNSGGPGAYSNEASATPEPPAPAPPTGLMATAGNASVTLNWGVVSGATSYNIYRGTTAGGESTTPIATDVTSLNYNDTGLTNNTTYYYKVAAVNGGGTGGLSNEASATPELTVPIAPTGLTATAGNASVTLNWSVVSGATSYNIYRGTTAGGESTTPIATDVPVPSYDDTGLFNNTKYYYKVAAVNSGGTGSLSNEASATPEPPVPVAPTGLTATAGNATVTLNWGVVSGATSYSVYRGTAAGGESPTAIATGVTAATYIDTAVTNNTTYYYKVAAVNNSGTGPLSNEASATPEPPVPSAPIGLTATAGNATVTLNWGVVSGATSYNIYRGTTAGGESTTPIATGITAATYNDTGLTNGTTYYYKVAGVNGGGTSGLSNEASAKPEPTLPIAPTGLTATAGNASVTLNWSVVSGATSYNIYRGTASGGESPTAIATGVTAATYIDTAVTNNTTYYYKVAAVNSGGTSGMSNEASATPKAPVSQLPPTAPTGLQATAGNASVMLNWTTTSGASSYNIYRGTTAGGESAIPIATDVTTNSFSDVGLTNGTTYYYKVAAVNSNGTSGMSNEASATPVLPAFTLTATTPSAVDPGSSAISTVTASTTTGYAGTVTLACALTTSPAGATDLPVCSAGSSTITLSGGATTGTATVTVTTAVFTGILVQPKTGGNMRGWTGGGAVLALLVLLGVPARRRSWRTMLGAIALIAVLSSMTACGGDFRRTTPINAGTSAGSYTFTVTGTGNPAVTPAPTTTFTLIVN
jgi:fibronectin type 3 domain-containing protein